VVTGDLEYNAALRPRITLKNLDGDTLYTYNAFSGSNPINVTYCDVEGAVGESGTFNITISDNQKLLDLDSVHNVKAFIELGKKESELQYFMIGFGDVLRVSRPITNQLDYNISGFGSAIQASQLFIHRRETYDKLESDAQIPKIIENALTKRLWRPLKKRDESIQDITGWSEDGISFDVLTPFTVLNKPFTYFSDLVNELADITGAVWYIDFTGGNETFTFTYNSKLHTPIVIKSGDLMDRLNDDGAKTSYIKQAFSIEDSATTEAGIATRLFTVTAQDEVKIFEQKDNNGFTNTTSRAIAQQVVINNDSRRIESVELLLSKNGDPQSEKNRLNGDIVLDTGANKPSNNVLDEFHIDLGSIVSNAKFIKVPVDISAKQLDVAQSKIWVRIFQRSNEEDVNGDPDGNSDPNPGTKHTIQWRHNNVLNVVQPLYSGTSTTAGGDSDLKDTFTWNVTNMGPLYGLRVNSNIRRLFARTNRKAANKLRLREQFIPTDFLGDPDDVMRYISLNLSQTSKGRRAIADFRVTIPNNFIFKPNQWVNFSDGLSEVADAFQVQRARYVMGSASGDPQIGTLHCDLTLSGLYNTLLLGCSCN
jgi:hypothetical protein